MILRRAAGFNEHEVGRPLHVREPSMSPIGPTSLRGRRSQMTDRAEYH